MSTYLCPYCAGETVYQSFSGGREWYCPGCKADGSYPEGAAPPRVQLLAEGRFDELRAEMREELRRRTRRVDAALGEPLPEVGCTCAVGRPGAPCSCTPLPSGGTP